VIEVLTLPPPPSSFPCSAWECTHRASGSISDWR
jgi:hypothetical protein